MSTIEDISNSTLPTQHTMLKYRLVNNNNNNSNNNNNLYLQRVYIITKNVFFLMSLIYT